MCSGTQNQLDAQLGCCNFSVRWSSYSVRRDALVYIVRMRAMACRSLLQQYGDAGNKINIVTNRSEIFIRGGLIVFESMMDLVESQ